MGLSGLVSDGAKALSSWFMDWDVPGYVPSPVCLEQIHRQCNCPSTGATAKQHQGLQEKLKTLSSPAAISEVSAQITVLQAQQDKLEIDRQDYHQQNLHALSQTIHPSTPGNLNLGSSYPLGCSPFWLMWSGWSNLCPTRAAAAIDVWQRQIPHLSGTIHAWWQWVLQALFPNPRPGYTTLVLTILLPWVYWHQKPKRHGTPNSNRATTKPLNKRTRFLAHSFTHTETLAQQQQWIDWAIWMCAKFQRIPLLSKDFFYLNGYLSSSFSSGLHGTNLVLTVIHNFDLAGDDTTLLNVCLENPFRICFDWVVLNMGELPRPRRTQKLASKKAHRTSCPVLSCYLPRLQMKLSFNSSETPLCKLLLLHFSIKTIC